MMTERDILKPLQRLFCPVQEHNSFSCDLAFIDNWNMVEQPLIFLSDSAKYPLSVYLAYINEGDLGLAFASGVFYMIPTVLIYLYGEKYFVEGIQLTGIK